MNNNVNQAYHAGQEGTSVSPNFISKHSDLGLFSNSASQVTWLYSSMLLAHEAAIANQPNAAASIYRECIAAAQTLWGNEHIETLEFQRAYANELTKLQQFQEAANIYQLVLTYIEPRIRQPGSDEQRLRKIFEEIATSKLVLVKTLYKQRNYRYAASVSEENFKLCERTLGNSHELTIRTRNDRDRCLTKQREQNPPPPPQFQSSITTLDQNKDKHQSESCPPKNQVLVRIPTCQNSIPNRPPLQHERSSQFQVQQVNPAQAIVHPPVHGSHSPFLQLDAAGAPAPHLALKRTHSMPGSAMPPLSTSWGADPVAARPMIMPAGQTSIASSLVSAAHVPRLPSESHSSPSGKGWTNLSSAPTSNLPDSSSQAQKLLGGQIRRNSSEALQRSVSTISSQPSAMLVHPGMPRLQQRPSSPMQHLADPAGQTYGNINVSGEARAHLGNVYKHYYTINFNGLRIETPQIDFLRGLMASQQNLQATQIPTGSAAHSGLGALNSQALPLSHAMSSQPLPSSDTSASGLRNLQMPGSWPELVHNNNNYHRPALNNQELISEPSSTSLHARASVEGILAMP